MSFFLLENLQLLLNNKKKLIDVVFVVFMIVKKGGEGINNMSFFKVFET
jgi:hypothetical protein